MTPVKDLDQFRGFMEYMIGKMRVNPQDVALLMSEQNSNLHDKEKIIQLVFEDFQHPAFFTIKKSILSLFANGRSTGLVLETGANITQIVPVSEGYTLGKSTITAQIGGDTMTQNILNHIEEKRGEELLPHFCYDYKFDPESSSREGQRKDIGFVEPSVLQFHKLRYVQEMKELLFKVATPSDEA